MTDGTGMIPPPPPGNDEARRPWFKRWWGIAIIAVFGLSVLGSLLDEGGEPEQQVAAEGAEAEVDASLAREDEAEEEAASKTAEEAEREAEARAQEEAEREAEEEEAAREAAEEEAEREAEEAEREAEEAEREAAQAAEEAEAAAAAEAELQNPDNYATLEDREFALLVKNPDDYIGDQIVLYGEVSQFDAATGNDTFRAQGSNALRDHWFLDGENVIVTGDVDLLYDVVADDVVKMHVTSLGSLTYGTQVGGETTVPMFHANIIELVD